MSKRSPLALALVIEYRYERHRGRKRKNGMHTKPHYRVCFKALLPCNKSNRYRWYLVKLLGPKFFHKTRAALFVSFLRRKHPTMDAWLGALTGSGVASSSLLVSDVRNVIKHASFKKEAHNEEGNRFEDGRKLYQEFCEEEKAKQASSGKNRREEAYRGEDYFGGFEGIL